MVHFMCIYLRILVSNTISISDDVGVINQNKASVISEAATTYCFWAPGFIRCSSEIHVAQSLIFV